MFRASRLHDYLCAESALLGAASSLAVSATVEDDDEASSLLSSCASSSNVRWGGSRHHHHRSRHSAPATRANCLVKFFHFCACSSSTRLEKECLVFLLTVLILTQLFLQLMNSLFRWKWRLKVDVFLCRQSISHNPFYDMLSARKKKAQNTRPWTVLDNSNLHSSSHKIIPDSWLESLQWWNICTTDWCQRQ